MPIIDFGEVNRSAQAATKGIPMRALLEARSIEFCIQSGVLEIVIGATVELISAALSSYRYIADTS